MGGVILNVLQISHETYSFNTRDIYQIRSTLFIVSHIMRYLFIGNA